LITRTDLFEPKNVPQEFQHYMLTLQRRNPMIEADTSAGAEVYVLPQAGLNPGTGQSNQNSEYVIVKTSPDANTVTVQGANGGDVVLTTNSGAGSVARFKSNGSVWYAV
jgi:hypothetical protein